MSASPALPVPFGQVLLFGITLKFFIKSPTNPPLSDEAASQYLTSGKVGTMRALLSYSLAAVFGLQLLMRPLHEGLVAYIASLRADGRE